MAIAEAVRDAMPERRLGEMLVEQKKNGGLNTGMIYRGTTQEPRDTTPTLAEIGIDKKLSSRAERRLGEMLVDLKATVGLAKGKRTDLVSCENQVDKRPTLSEIGIDKNISFRAQKLAAVPEDNFEVMVGEWRAEYRGKGDREKCGTSREPHYFNPCRGWR